MITATHIEIMPKPRYWEDAEVDGVEDVDGLRIPQKENDTWHIFIRLDDGMILDWPKWVTAKVHYKVCDDGEYWLTDCMGLRVAKWCDHYVPDKFLCHPRTGYGDHIIFNVDERGCIADWKRPVINADEWESITGTSPVNAGGCAVVDWTENPDCSGRNAKGERHE